MRNLAALPEPSEYKSETPTVERLHDVDLNKVDNHALRRALERIRRSDSATQIHAGHYVKHSSHSSHSKGLLGKTDTNTKGAADD